MTEKTISTEKTNYDYTKILMKTNCNQLQAFHVKNPSQFYNLKK